MTFTNTLIVRDGSTSGRWSVATVEAAIATSSAWGSPLERSGGDRTSIVEAEGTLNLSLSASLSLQLEAPTDAARHDSLPLTAAIPVTPARADVR